MLRQLLLALPPLLAGPVAAQTLTGQPTGRVIERLISPSDTTQAYALYLPTAYRPDTVWPVLFLMDPRGRALLPMKLFQPAAERLGYVVISSYNTASDTVSEVNYVGFNTMLRDVQQGLSMNPSRIYLSGFSGTSRAAWVIASHLQGHVAGLIGVGAGLPEPAAWLDATFIDHRFGVYLITGDRDFNYQEVQRLDRLLGERAWRHGVATFDGEHSWPPERLASRALEWMTLDAMWRRLAPLERRWADSLAAAYFEAARRAESAGRKFEAYEGYLAVAAQFDGVVNVDSARSRAEALSKQDPVGRRLDQMREDAEREREFERALAGFIQAARTPDNARNLDRARSRLRLKNLKKDAGSEDDPSGLAASRMLESVFVHAGFYLPRELLQARRFEDAAAVLEVALEVQPGSNYVCLALARAYTQLKRNREALQQLACATEGGAIPREKIASDPLLAPLARDPEFRRLVGTTQASPS